MAKLLKKVVKKSEMEALLNAVKGLATEPKDLNYFYENLKDKNFTLKEVKAEFLDAVNDTSVWKKDSYDKVIEIVFGKDAVQGDEPKAEKPKADKPKAEKPKKSPTGKKQENGLEADTIFELVGYGYTKAVFPEVIESSKVVPNYVLHRLDADSLGEILEKYDVADLMLACFIPSFMSTMDINPMGVIEANPRQVLKDTTGSTSFPHDLDLHEVLYASAEANVMASVSLFTDIPYTINADAKWFTPVEETHARCMQYGLEYAVYYAEEKKK